MPNDSIVAARMVLQAQLELQRMGHRRVLAMLEAREPDLTEWILESTTALYHQVLNTGAEPRHARRIHHAAEATVLVSVLALRKAHVALWADGPGKDIQARLEAPTPPVPPPADPAA